LTKTWNFPNIIFEVAHEEHITTFNNISINNIKGQEGVTTLKGWAFLAFFIFAIMKTNPNLPIRG